MSVDLVKLLVRVDMEVKRALSKQIVTPITTVNRVSVYLEAENRANLTTHA